MTISQAAKQVLETKTAHMVRRRKDEPKQYDVKEIFTGNKRGWVMLDLFTASALVAVYNRMSAENQVKFDAAPVSILVHACLRMVA